CEEAEDETALPTADRREAESCCSAGSRVFVWGSSKSSKHHPPSTAGLHPLPAQPPERGRQKPPSTNGADPPRAQKDHGRTSVSLSGCVPPGCLPGVPYGITQQDRPSTNLHATAEDSGETPGTERRLASGQPRGRPAAAPRPQPRHPSSPQVAQSVPLRPA